MLVTWTQEISGNQEETSITEGKFSWKTFSENTETVPEMDKVVPCAASGFVKNYSSGTGFEGMTGSQREDEAWHCERAGKTTGEGIAFSCS